MSYTGAQTPYGVIARCLSTSALSPFRAAGLKPQVSCMPQLLHIQRSFASGELPPHIQMEMPALSPTMSQVKSTFTAPSAVLSSMASDSFQALRWELLTGSVSDLQPPCCLCNICSAPQDMAMKFKLRVACREILPPGRRKRERSLQREMFWQRLRQTRSDTMLSPVALVSPL